MVALPLLMTALLWGAAHAAPAPGAGRKAAGATRDRVRPKAQGYPHPPQSRPPTSPSTETRSTPAPGQRGDRPLTVLLYDAASEEQAALAAVAREVFAPYAERIEFTPVAARSLEGYEFRRRYRLDAKELPCQYVVLRSGGEGRIGKRFSLEADAPLRENVRLLLAALRLPVPRLEIPEPGVLLTVPADGSGEEKKRLLYTAGHQEILAGARQFDVGSLAVYRVRLPAALRQADLLGELGGSFVVEWANRDRGPWTPLMESARYFGPADGLIPGRVQPVVDLTRIIRDLPGALFLRVRPSTHGAGRAELVRLEVIARGPRDDSRETLWLAEAERLRVERVPPPSGPVVRTQQLSGELAGTRTLQEALSPYFLVGDVTVPFGSKLIVEAGVEIRVLGRQGIRVLGDLEFRGNPAKPIRIGPSVEQQADDWAGIRITPLLDRPAGAGTVLRHTRIRNAAHGLELARFVGEITGCEFENCATGLLLRDGGQVRVVGNRFVRCRSAVVVAGGAGRVNSNLFRASHVALDVIRLPDGEVFEFAGNTVLESQIAAVAYRKDPSRTAAPLVLSGNYWGEVPGDRLVSPEPAAPVLFDPRLTAPLVKE